MGWVAAAALAYQWYSDQQNRKLQKKLSTPLPVYLKYAWNPVQKQQYDWMSPYMAGMYGQPGTATTAADLSKQKGTSDLWASRQYGGPVEGQAPYLVGEAPPGQTRPEMFVPDQPGQNPYLVGTQGPEVFNPEQRGEIVPMTPPQGQNQAWQMSDMGLTPRQTGGTVTPAGTKAAEEAKAVIGTMPTPGAAPAPTQDWYANLDPSVRAGIEAPYTRGMEMLESRLQGRGALGAQRAGISGAAADVMGQYTQEASKTMAQTGWGMVQPGLMQKQQQAWEGKLLPYKMLPSLLPYMMPTAYTTTTAPGTTAAAAAPGGTSAQYPYGKARGGWNQFAWDQMMRQRSGGVGGAPSTGVTGPSAEAEAAGEAPAGADW